MTAMRAVFSLPLAIFLCSAVPVRADLEEALSQLTGEGAKRYVSPIVSGFGANMNAGWYHKAPPGDKFKISIEGGFVFMGALLGEGDASFNVQQLFRLNRTEATEMTDQFLASNPQFLLMRGQIIDSLISKDFQMGLYGPTVIGPSSDSVRVAFNPPEFNIAGQPVNIPEDTMALPVGGVLEDFKDYPLPLMAPQFSIGTVYGTNLTLRWMPSFEIPEIGTFKYFGFGVQHNPQVWLGKKLPVDLSLSLFTQKLSVGTLFETGTFSLGANVSKTLGWRLLNATPYAGIAMEKSTMNFKYDFLYDSPGGAAPRTQPVKFELEGDNKARMTVGLSLRLLIMNINLDYSLAKYPTISAGVMFGY